MKIRQRMEATEEKLILLENAKRRLYQNSSEVKSQIHSQMSRLLEALRNREVQLLNQVDHMQTQREEALHKQHAVLSRTLGQLQRAVVSSEEEDKNLESFERLSLNDVLPEEIPYMTFKPTPIGLNDLMMNFGKITANGVPLPDNRSASLPKQFEDYGDAEHHVLYKTVEKIQQGLNSEKKIYVKIPRLTSASNSEWLAKQKSTTTTPSLVGKCVFSPFKESKSDCWLAKTSSPSPTVTPVYLPQMAKNTSIQHWLHQIKQNPANEEDGFEMLDKVDFCSDGDTDSIEIVSSSPPSTFHTPQYKIAGDKRSHDVDNSQWLSAKRKVVAIEKPANLPTFSYFKKLAAQDNSIWLAKKKSNSVVTKSSCCGGGNMSKNYDIENLGDCDFIDALNKNLKTFSPGARKPLRSKCDENVDSLLPPVSSLCIANEVCEKYSECLSQPSCIEQKWLMKKPDSSPEKNSSNNSLNKVDDAVLLMKSPSLVNVTKADNKNKEMTALFSPFRKKSATSDWLKKTDKENVPAKNSPLKMKNAGSFCQVDDWLFKPNTKRQPAAKFILHQEKDLKSWLLKPTSNDTNMIHG